MYFLAARKYSFVIIYIALSPKVSSALFRPSIMILTTLNIYIYIYIYK